MKKVLIITYSYPPLNNIASRRFGDLSKYLKECDWEPFVLTTNSVGHLNVAINEGNIIRIGTHPQKTTEIQSPSNKGNKILSMKRKIGLNFRVFDRTYFSWYREITKMNLEELKQKNFDIIIASFGPGAALYAGKFLSRKLNIPWIADFRDLGALYKDLNFKRNFVTSAIDFSLERNLLKTASAITTVSNGLKEELNLHYNNPSYVIYNGWEDTTIENEEKVSLDERPYIYYAGRFYPHQLESIFLLFNCLNKSKLNIKVKIRSLGPGYLNDILLKYAKEIGLNKKIEMLPAASPTVVEFESMNSLVNLVVEDLDKKYRWKKGTITGKLLPLLIKPAPILAIARDDSEIGEILESTCKGKLCSTESQIESFLLKMGKYKEKCISKENINEVLFFSKERQAKELANILNKYKRG
ncbi:TPR/glycosyl transferase domain protein [Bacillus freudenreichii]|nr:TPR/glycosyl transferase domain protein [Bacillus freudenreichii]